MKRVFALLFAVIMALGLVACGEKAPATTNTSATTTPTTTVSTSDVPESTAAPVAEPVDIVLEGGKYGYPNPFQHSSKGPGTFKMRLVYDSLIIKDEEGLIPWVATDYSVSSDGLTYTFNIRKGVKWHDGEALTTEDVVFTYEYYKDHLPVSSSLSVNNQYRIAGVVDNGDGSVSISVYEPLATDLAAIAYVPLIPKHIWENVEDPYNYTGEGDCIGSGPYVLSDISIETGEYKFEAFDDYWGKHLINSVTFVSLSDSVLAFDNGEADYLNAPWDLYDKYANDPACKAVENQPFLGWNMMYNMEKNPELADVNVRQAIAYAIDREAILNLVLNGHGYVASAAYLPVGHVMRNENIKTYSYDVEKAKELLGGKTYSFVLSCGDNAETIKICDLIAMYLKDVGIEITVQSMDNSSLSAARKDGNYDIYMSYGGGWGSDPDNLRTIYAGYDPTTGETLSGNAILGYYNEDIFNLAQEQIKCVDVAERTDIIMNLQELIAEEVPCLPIINATDMLVTHPSKYDGWRFKYDHNYSDSCLLSFVDYPDA